MEKAKVGEYLGITYLIVFIIFNVGIFMSLFVAIITALFEKFEEDENVYQMIETLRIRAITQADKKYSCLISFPPPFNFFLLFIGPILLTAKNPEKMNE